MIEKQPVRFFSKIFFFPFSWPQVMSCLLALACLLTQSCRPCSARGPSLSGRGESSPAVVEFKEKMHKETLEHLEALDKKGRNFVETLKGRDKAEILSLAREYKTGFYNENCEFRRLMHARRRDFFQKRFEAMPWMKEDAVSRVLGRLDLEFEELKSFHEGKHRENMAFLDELAADDSMAEQRVLEAMGDFFKSQKEDARLFIEGQRNNRGVGGD